MRDIVENNISSELLKDWHARFYSDGVFNNRSSDAHVVGLYSMDLRLIYGEYNKLQEDDTLVLDPSDFPTLLRGVSEESKEYMYDLSKRNGYANVLNGRNNEPSFLVSMVPVLDENETEVGYFLWAGELRRAIQEISESKTDNNNNNNKDSKYNASSLCYYDSCHYYCLVTNQSFLLYILLFVCLFNSIN